MLNVNIVQVIHLNFNLHFNKIKSLHILNIYIKREEMNARSKELVVDLNDVQKKKARVISKKYRERKKQLNQEFENRLKEIERGNSKLSNRIEFTNQVLFILRFEIFKNYFMKYQSC